MSAREEIVPVFVPHLGCPHDCVFCNQRRISGRQEPATAETVHMAIAQAAALPRTGAKRQLAFYGGSFTAVPFPLQETLLGAAREGIEAGVIDSIRLSTRPDAVDESVLRRLRAYGVETVELGAQSMDDEVLRLSRRGHTAADVEKAAGLVRAAGFQLILQMMTGLPGDTDDKCLRTAEKLIALRPDGVRIYPAVIVRGTELCELWKAGEYREHTVEDAVRVCARLLPLFEAAGIPVIRLGLNPTEELSAGAAVGGAYHPALGELVKSRVWLDRARGLLAGTAPGSRATLRVHPTRLSQMLGQRRANVETLREEFSLRELRVLPGAAGRNELLVEIDPPEI
ncbi:MAG: radical SAM protein [Oscillospiraceae bacterium]|nr:radical SAM protein [Oscillospiraceae bacterium]